jgi:hypothetical protein
MVISFVFRSSFGFSRRMERITLSIMRHARCLQQQGAGVTFDQMLEQAGEGVRGVIKAVALPPNRPKQEVYESLLAARDLLRKSVRDYFERHGIVARSLPKPRMPVCR